MVDITIDAMHCSMQFSDNTAQKRQDAKRIFERADKRKVWWITGTEAGMGQSADLRKALQEQAKDKGYRFHVTTEVWIAVRREVITTGTYREGDIPILDSSAGVGKHTDRGLLWSEFGSEAGRISVGCAHLLTQGARPSDPNYDENAKMIRVIGEWGRFRGKDTGLAFFGGDMNINDAALDVFRGGPFTTLADELKKHPSTGHGPIDVIASYNGDGRVKGKYWRALDDQDLPLHTDHYAVEGGFTVQTRRKP